MRSSFCHCGSWRGKGGDLFLPHHEQCVLCSLDFTTLFPYSFLGSRMYAAQPQQPVCNMLLKGSVKEKRWEFLDYDRGPWRSRFIYFLMLPSSSCGCISVAILVGDFCIRRLCTLNCSVRFPLSREMDNRGHREEIKT